MPKLPDPPDQPPINEYPIACAYCERKITAAMPLETLNDANELFAFACSVADAQGWGYGHAWLDGELQPIYVCSACVKKPEEAMARALPRFDVLAHCPACDHDEVDVRHCHGRTMTCELGAPRNHLHRKCKRCGWSWIEGRLDDER